YSVVVAACTRPAARSLRIVDDHAHASGFVDHLDAIHRAPFVRHALGAEYLSAGAALDPADAVGQHALAVAALPGDQLVVPRALGLLPARRRPGVLAGFLAAYRRATVALPGLRLRRCRLP